MSALAAPTCAFCPGRDVPADGQLVDRIGVTRDVCSDCAALIWAGAWGAMEAEIVLYQLAEAGPLARLTNRRRARRIARRWTTAVRVLTVGAHPNKEARRG